MRYEEYCKVRNQVRNLTRKAVINKEKEIAKEVKKNPKKFWQYTQSKTKTRTGISDLLMDEQNGIEILTKNDTDKANTLSSFFSSVFTTDDCEHIPLIEDKQLTSEVNNIEINEEKVRKKKKLSELNISKSSGPNSMYPRILHDLCEELANPIILYSKTLLKLWKYQTNGGLVALQH